MRDKGVIAVIEPNEEVRSLYVKYFTSHGYSVIPANYIEGIPADVQVVVAEPHDVSTTVFVREFLAYHTTSKQLIVASGRPDTLHGTLHTRAFALTKPFHMAELEECVDVALNPKLLSPGASTVH